MNVVNQVTGDTFALPVKHPTPYNEHSYVMSKAPSRTLTLDINSLYIRILYVRSNLMIAAGIKRGTAELAVLSILQGGALHGYEIARRIEQETKGSLRFTLAALYPMLYRLEKQKWIRGSLGNQPHRTSPPLLPPHPRG